MSQYNTTAAKNCATCPLSIFSVCSQAAERNCAEILSQVPVIKLGKGGIVVNETDESPSVILIIKGALRTIVSDSDGRMQLVAISRHGDLLTSPGTNQPWGVKVEASKDSKLLLIDSQLMQYMRSQVADIDQKLYFIARKKIAEQQIHAFVISKMKPQERLAYFLMQYFQNEPNSTAPIVLDVTRSEIAGYLGLEAETVSRLFTSLKKDGLIELPKPSHVLIKDISALKELAKQINYY